MTCKLYPILPLPREETKTRIRAILDMPGELKGIAIANLRVDGAYQRNLSQSGVNNIRKIVEEFSWSKFLPVIVVRADEGEGIYCIIDGQHRSTAALTRGIEVVPCYVLSCSQSEAAAAFAAINGNVTPMLPVDLWFARLAAGDGEALELQSCLNAADVKITRKKDGLAVGETRSINVLLRAHKSYGDALLTTILQCITQTSEGNAGLIVGSVIHGIGFAIRNKPDLLANPSRLFDIFDTVDLGEILYQARIEQAKTGNILQAILAREINAILRGAMAVS